MKKIYLLSILLLPNLLYAQNVTKTDYDKLWQEIKHLENKDLPKSILEKVENIYEISLSENNETQLLKSVAYRVKYQTLTSKDGMAMSIKQLEKEISLLPESTHSLMNLLLAKMYANYYHKNKYVISENSNISDNADFNTEIEFYDEKKITSVIIQKFLLALNDNLKSVKTESYADFIGNYKYSKDFYPTVYDNVAYFAIEEISSLSDFDETFEDKYLCNFEDFINLKIDSDSTSTIWAITNIYQKILNFHKNDTNHDAFVAWNLNRIDFYFAENQDKKIEALNAIYNQYSDSEVAIYVAQRLADLLYETDKIQEAIELLSDVIEKHPQSKHIPVCKNLKNEYSLPDLGFQIENIISSDKNFPILISYKNIDSAYVSIIKIDSDKFRENNISETEILKLYKNANFRKTELVKFPKRDYFNHSAEYVCKGLSYGFYAMIIHTNPEIKKENNFISYKLFNVSDLCLLKIKDTKYLVLDRNSGNPIKNAGISIFQKYGYQNGNKVIDYICDENGKFVIGSELNNYYYQNEVEIKNGNDTAIFDRLNFYFRSEKYEEKQLPSIKIFTDRAIYRPGQIVNYKGIVYVGKDDVYNIESDFVGSVVLKNSNWQEIDRQSFNSNEYGSFNGSFIIPQNTLTGNFYIYDNEERNIATIKVEEYKRPTFEVTFLDNTEEIKLNDTIKLKGQALSYSGIPISNATVNYTINCSMISRWWWDIYHDNEEIGNGSISTDENGFFDITFVAKNIFSKAVNMYKIEADVVDINGETQIGYTSIFASENSLWLSQNIMPEVEISKFNGFTVKAENISGQSVNSLVTIEIHKLKDLSKVLDPQKHDRFDTKLYTKEEWEELCPGTEYDNEISLENRALEKLVFKNSINTETNSEVLFSEKTKFECGNYRVVLKSTDKYGNPVSDTSFFKIYDQQSSKMPFVASSFFKLSTTEAQPGDKVYFIAGSSYQDVTLYYNIQEKGEIGNIKSIKINNEIKKIEIPISESSYGNISITAIFVKNGNFFETNETVNVKRRNKELNVELITFRDKMLPGSQEAWTMKITDKDNNPVNAELLSTIYDASLDSFSKNVWILNPYQSFYVKNNFESYDYAIEHDYNIKNFSFERLKSHHGYPEFYFYDFITAYRDRMYGLYKNAKYSMTMSCNEVAEDEYDLKMSTVEETSAKGMDAASVYEENFEKVEIRKNFNETALWSPNLSTDKDGNIFLNFKMPESLTRWNFMALAHSKDMKIGNCEKTIITQKKVSITPNLPRYFRENDKIFISAKIANLTEEKLNGKAQIEFIDIKNSNVITEIFTTKNIANFTIDSLGNAAVEWEILIPENIQAVAIRIVAVAGGHSDGEEKVLPILTNRMLVTESMPLPVRTAGNTKFSLESMKNNNSKTLDNYSYTVEFTSNPAWYALLSLPYMMEYPYECAEQTFSRLYANSISAYVLNSDANIKKIFDSWKKSDAEALQSKIQNNEELKNILIENSPWINDCKNETESKSRLANLFDQEKVDAEVLKNIDKLKKMQLSNGAFPWFAGMSESNYITQYIVGGFGHLEKMNIEIQNDDIKNIISKSISYIDKELVRIYVKDKELNKDKISIGYYQIQYLYVRSFFIKDYPLDKKTKEVFDYYCKSAISNWKNFNLYMRGMLALSLNRYGEIKAARDISKSIKEYALYSDELGMYWEFENGFYWYQAPIETQALLIEMFDEVCNDQKSVEEMKVWLLKQKQTQNWSTTKSTAEAVYSLLLKGCDILQNNDIPVITIGNKTIDNNNIETEEGTGYFKKTWEGNEIENSWSEITVSKKENSVSWGSVYWQYFEDLDKILQFKETPLKIKKDLFVNKIENGKTVIVPIKENTKVTVGDKLTIRIEINVDRDMEYVHLKDMRASGFEPVEKLSGYRYQNRIGYYMSIKDASIDFFMDNLQKGKYLFEYEVFATQKGVFSNGIATIQSMYAPEFSSHSNGIIIDIKE